MTVSRIGLWWDSMREAARDYAELHERRVLLRRPWEEEFLHWALEPDGWRLHGRVWPPNARRRYGVTRTGWCIALRDRSRPY
ncbi:MAG: hypothetical protein ACRDTA_06745 [Pseudonocardiaceae bacterium]